MIQKFGYSPPVLISLTNGILSVFGLSAGYEYYFFIAAILCGVMGSQTKNLLRTSLFMGVLIAAATGIPQVIFIDTYFINNPDYAVLAETLPLNPQAYTLVMIPLLGAIMGLLIAGLSWILSRIMKR